MNRKSIYSKLAMALVCATFLYGCSAKTQGSSNTQTQTNASIKGSGAEVKKGKVTIASAGTYVISGKLDNGQIIVDAKDKGTVKLVLNGAQINSSDKAPIYVKNAGKTIISLEAGMENIITDGTKYT